MTLHAVLKYLVYKWKAKNRHGVHSPFAYAFVENIVENKKGLALANIRVPWTSRFPVRYDRLVKRMMAYYGYTCIVNASLKDGALNTCDVLLIDENDPLKWQQLFKDNQRLIADGSAVIITGIHKTINHTSSWDDIRTNDPVRMSIDLNGVGILFFRKEFRERQHFMLRAGK